MTSEKRRSQAPVQGHVAMVLNERELLINVGKQDGVTRGMRFAVLAEEPLRVEDPITGEMLGTRDQEKVRVEASEVQDRFTVCRTYYYREAGGGFSDLATIGEMLGPRRRIYDTLDATKEAYPAPLPPDQSYVKVRDRVKEIDDDD